VQQQLEELLLVLQREQPDQALEVLQGAADEAGVQDPFATALQVELQLLAPRLEASSSRAGSILTGQAVWLPSFV